MSKPGRVTVCNPRDTQMLPEDFLLPSSLHSFSLSSLNPTFPLIVLICFDNVRLAEWMLNYSEPVERPSPRSSKKSRLETDFSSGRVAGVHLLHGDCGFWSINNGLHSFTATECRYVKIYRKYRVMKSHNNTVRLKISMTGMQQKHQIVSLCSIRRS